MVPSLIFLPVCPPKWSIGTQAWVTWQPLRRGKH